MNEITVRLPDDLLGRLQGRAEREALPLETVIETALAAYVTDEVSHDPDKQTEAEFLAGLRRAMNQALTGDYRPAREVLAEIEREAQDDADAG